MTITYHPKKRGPKTVLGKRRSSMNAKTHGLSIPIQRQSEFAATVERLTNLILPTDRVGEGLDLARNIAEAYCEVERIRRLSYNQIYDLSEVAWNRKQKYRPQAFGTSIDLTPYLSRAYGRLRSSIRHFDACFELTQTPFKQRPLDAQEIFAAADGGEA